MYIVFNGFFFLHTLNCCSCQMQTANFHFKNLYSTLLTDWSHQQKHIMCERSYDSGWPSHRIFFREPSSQRVSQSLFPSSSSVPLFNGRAGTFFTYCSMNNCTTLWNWIWLPRVCAYRFHKPCLQFFNIEEIKRGRCYYESNLAT